MNNLQLQIHANDVRKGVIMSTNEAGSGHPGGSLSCTDILTYLYFEEMNVDPENPKDPQRDRFVLSKGHAAPALYSVLAQRGYFSVDLLKTLRKFHSDLQGHPSMHHLPGLEMSTGSLGQGFSAAVGMALAAKMDKADWRVYTILGDGEIQEGEVWEAAMLAANHGLNNLVALVTARSRTSTARIPSTRSSRLSDGTSSISTVMILTRSGPPIKKRAK